MNPVSAENAAFESDTDEGSAMARTRCKPMSLDALSLRSIADALASASSGSRELDYLLAVGCGMLSERGIGIIASGKNAGAMEAVAVDRAVPPFSTSLDAALPGEEIVAVARKDAPGGGVWTAEARCQRSRSSVTVSAQARTEALARRAAAVQVMLAALSRKRDPSENLRIRSIVLPGTAPLQAAA